MSDNRPEGWRERLEGLVPPGMSDLAVCIVGCGSVGSYIAVALARTGIRRFVLVDPDVVEAPNLTRTVYGHADLGKPKVEALRERLSDVFPDVEVNALNEKLTSDPAKAKALLGDAHLVVGAIDDPAATATLDRFCYALGTPLLQVALWAGARGGEFIVVWPEKTACTLCSTGRRRGEFNVDARRSSDYGSGRLVAEVALGTDIHFVCAAAVKAALSMLSLGKDAQGQSPLARFIGDKVNEGVNYVMFSMSPEAALFKHFQFADSPSYAYQSLWVRPERDPECDRCGPLEWRESPFEA